MVKSQISLVAALLFLVPQVVEAQAEQRTAPVIGIALGFTKLPEPFINDCGGNTRTFPTLEFKAGAAGNRWSVETRAAVITAPVVYGCMHVYFPHESGVHTDRFSPYDRGNGDVSLSAQLWYTPTARFISFGIGAGHLFRVEKPYFSMAGQLRTRGPFAFVVEAQSNWSRLRAELVTAEWQQRQQIRIIETSSDHKWHVTYGIRLGFDWKLP